jgi:GH15 family glucan-1,4-alpha-glucosidase
LARSGGQGCKRGWLLFENRVNNKTFPWRIDWRETLAARIDDCGLIVDMKGAALASKGWDIDWVCVPRFYSKACMAALLGKGEHGRWAIRPTTRIRKSEQRYRGDTLILETEVECDGGRFRIIDFMPVAAEGSDIVRLVETRLSAYNSTGSLGIMEANVNTMGCRPGGGRLRFRRP